MRALHNCHSLELGPERLDIGVRNTFAFHMQPLCNHQLPSAFIQLKARVTEAALAHQLPLVTQVNLWTGPRLCKIRILQQLLHRVPGRTIDLQRISCDQRTSQHVLANCLGLLTKLLASAHTTTEPGTQILTMLTDMAPDIDRILKSPKSRNHDYIILKFSATMRSRTAISWILFEKFTTLLYENQACLHEQEWYITLFRNPRNFFCTGKLQKIIRNCHALDQIEQK